SSAAELGGMAYRVNSNSSYGAYHYILTADIDLSAHLWIPIGISSTYPFAGNFSGAGFIISGMQIGGTVTYAGLFGYMYGDTALIENVNLVEIEINTTSTSIGGIVGYQAITVKNCKVTGNINGVATYIGGITGIGSNIYNCSSGVNILSIGSGNITNAGGIVGYTTGGTILNCHNIGSIEIRQGANIYAGGIAGDIGTSVSTIKYCYNFGSINAVAVNFYATPYVIAGGLVGYSPTDDTTIVSYCYNVGNVYSSSTTTTHAYSGGLVGQMIGGYITSCYNTGIIDSVGYMGSIIGYASTSPTLTNIATSTESATNVVGTGTPTGSNYSVRAQASAFTQNTVYYYAAWTDDYFKTPWIFATSASSPMLNQIVTVTFDGNGNTGGSTTAQMFIYGTTANLTANGFTKTSATFAGWSTVSTAGSVNYADQASYTATADITLYARWEVIITYTANGVTGSNYTQAFIIGIAENLNANTFTYTGATFAGWATTAGGTVAYINQASYTATAAATLYAKWTPNAYQITYSASSATGTWTYNSTYYTYTANTSASTYVVYGQNYGYVCKTSGGTYASSIAQPVPVRTGYTFNGWFTASSGGTQITISTTVSVTTNTTYYAQWTAINYSITIAPNSGTGGSASPSTYNISASSQTSTLTHPTRTGYTLSGYTVTGHTGTIPTVSGTTLTIPANTYGNLTLTANWTAKSISVTISAGANGAITGSSATGTYHTGDTLTLVAVPNTGYQFSSWTENASGTISGASTTYVLTGTDGDAGTVTITANFTSKLVPITITIGTGGTNNGSTANGSYAIGTVIDLKATANSGYRFVNWTKVNGSGTIASATSLTTTYTIVAADTEAGSTIAFTANFTNLVPITITIGTGGTNNSSTANGSYAVGTVIDLKATANSGYRFVNWTKVNGSGTIASSTSLTTTYTIVAADGQSGSTIAFT
ncbi:InlB B-repeat-containing protein, partial [bacterium]|nr:InlB B-repeat-containing protein [bacterium]